MKRPMKTLCLFVLLAGVGLVSCGGGGGNVPGGMMGGGVTASFTPDNATPGANSISMLAGNATNDTFQIVVTATDIADFFGAAFRIRFDSASAEFQSFDSTNSFLNNHPDAPVVDIRAIADPADPDAILIVATVQQVFGYVEGFFPMAGGDQELLTVTFRATGATAGNTFSFDTAASREVTTCPMWNMIGLPPDCPEIPDANLVWNGGVLTAN